MGGFLKKRHPGGFPDPNRTSGGLVRLGKIVCLDGAEFIHFRAIPQHYTDLEIRFQARSKYAANIWGLSIALNDDGDPANYTSARYMESNTAAAVTGGNVSVSWGLWLLNLAAATATAGLTGSGTIRIENYSGSAFWKRMTFNGAGLAATNSEENLHTTGLWKNPSPVRDVALATTSGFVDHSVFTLYGLGAA